MEDNKKLFEWIESKVSLKKLGLAILTLLMGGGAGIGIEFSIIEDKIQEIAQPAIDKTVSTVVDHKVYSVLDSTLEAMSKEKKISFREQLANELRIPKDSIVPVITRWYLREKGITNVGLFKEGGRIKYRDIDGEVYIPAYDDSTQRYYFLHPGTQQTHWCL